MSRNILIAYFSREGNNYVNGKIVNLPVGNTEVAAKMIKKLTGGALFKIDPVKEYSKDYTACTKEAQAELHADARPELSEYLDSLDSYDTIILCYPNWWGTMPMAVSTFLERYDFAGKTILPLCTHEGSGMGRSEQDIKKLCPGATMGRGLAVRGGSVKNAEKDIKDWLNK
ncbi:MAG: flavodoxin [Armatimonadota bacterium]|nr:NAD(P)H-dependent oxidoreductase [bacterium]